MHSFLTVQSMQAAVLPSSPLSPAVSSASKLPTSGSDAFGSALTKSMASSAPAGRGNEVDGKKTLSKTNTGTQPSGSDPATGKQTVESANPLFPAPPSPSNLLQLIGLPLTPTQGTHASASDQVAAKPRGGEIGGPQTGTGASLSARREEKSIQSLDSAVGVALTAVSQWQVAELEDPPDPAPEPASAGDFQTPTTTAEIATAGVASPSFEKSGGELDVALRAAATGPVLPPPPADASTARDTSIPAAIAIPALTFKEFSPQDISTTAKLSLPPTSLVSASQEPVGAGKSSSAPGDTSVSHRSAKAENLATENTASGQEVSTSATAPSEAGTSEPVRLEAGTLLSLAAVKALRVGAAENHGSASPTNGKRNGPAKSGDAEILAQTFGGTVTFNKPAPSRSPAIVETPQASNSDPDKKSPAANPQTSAPLHELAVGTSFAKETGATTPVPAEGASAIPLHEASSETLGAPRAHQMLDSAPLPASALPVAHVPSDAGGDAQIHLGVRTSAFGVVEVYTSVHQNEVGLAVHGERGLSQWFGTEVQSLESGLKDHHLHLTTVEMDGGSTALQTATSSHPQQQQQPQRHLSAMTGWRNGASLELESETEPATAHALILLEWSKETRVSIHI